MNIGKDRKRYWLHQRKAYRCTASLLRCILAEAAVRDQAQDFKHHGRPDQCRVAGLVEGWGDFDHITPDKVKPPQATQQSLGLKRGDTPDLRGAGARCIDRVETIDIK